MLSTQLYETSPLTQVQRLALYSIELSQHYAGTMVLDPCLKQGSYLQHHTEH
jgi:hypothetical protein